MQREVKKHLFDMLSAISSIQNFTADIRSYEEFRTNDLVIKGVERSLEIIAEAISRIKKIDNTVDIKHSQKIIALRNRIIHAYDNVNYDIVWGIVKNHIPVLKSEIEELLGSS